MVYDLNLGHKPCGHESIIDYEIFKPIFLKNKLLRNM